MLLLGVLDLVVTDAVQALHEHHHRGHAGPRHFRGVVERAGVDGLNRIKGVSARMPKGAFYVFANTTGTGWPSKRIADALLEQAGVAALSGTAFGSFGEGYLRFSVANSMENLMEALERIDAWTKANL